MDDGLLHDLDVIAVASVALTARAIMAVDPDLTFLQWRVLLVVGSGRESLAVGEVARRVGANPSPMSRLLARLSARGLATTVRDGQDGRVVRVRLTTDGQRMRRTVLEHRKLELGALADWAGLERATSTAALARAFERIL